MGIIVAERKVGWQERGVRRQRVMRQVIDQTGHKSDLRGLSNCGRPRGGAVAVARNPSNRYVAQGLQYCRSSNLCAYCSPWRRVRLAERWGDCISAYLADGWKVYMVVLTMSHSASDQFSDVFADLKAGWRNLYSSARGRRLLRGVSWCRSLDITWSSVNGVHPHYNFLVALPPGYEYDFESELRLAWQDFQERDVSQLALHFSVVTKSQVDDRAGYLAGVPHSRVEYSQDAKWTAATEATRADIKRSGAGYTPFQLLDQGADWEYAHIWVSLALVLKGQRLFSESKLWRLRCIELGMAKELDEWLDELQSNELLGDSLCYVLTPVWMRNDIGIYQVIDECNTMITEGISPEVVDGILCERLNNLLGGALLYDYMEEEDV